VGRPPDDEQAEVFDAAPLFGRTKAQVQYGIDLEQAVLRLLAVTRPDDREAVAEELARRAALMGEIPAYASVYDDVVSGRWPGDG
jgi:hypothetical protein